MKKRIFRVLSLFLAVSCVLSALLTVNVAAANDGSSYVYDGYIYDYWGNVKESPAAFILERTIDKSTIKEVKLSSIDDVCTSTDGRIFVIDSVESRMNVFDSNGAYVASVKLLRNKDGKIALDEQGNQIMLNAPEGVFVHEKNNEIYLADTGNQRVLVLDLTDYTLKKIIGAPDNMNGTALFKPSKITVDNADRIYIVVQSSYEGIIELTSDGSFSGFYGVNTPRVSLTDYFWKSISSDEQKAQMAKTYAPSFNNITLDGEGFVMAVTYDSSAADKVFRLNSKGENVLREEGNINVVGEIWRLHSDDSESKFVDLAVTDYGTYACLDKQQGKVFLYNFDGELLNVFGSLGNVKGEFKDPSAIAWLGNKLVIGDRTLKCVYVLAPTEFGSAVLNGNKYYYYGEWDTALGYFEQALKLNVNYDVAYTGIGKNYLMKNEYRTAMEYFKLGQNREFYSKAYNGFRNETLEKYFPIIMAAFVIIIGTLIYSEIRYHKNSGKRAKAEERVPVIKHEKLYYLKRAIMHPFDGFYEIRFRNKGSIVLAVILLMAYAIIRCIEFQYTGFIMNKNELNTMNSLSIFMGTMAVFILFAVSNWSVTTLLNGNGNIKSILTVIGYSMVPLMLVTIIKVFFSNFIIMEEVMIVDVVFAIGVIWSVFMLLVGLLTVHEYSFGKNLAALFLTFIAAIIIVFIGMLIFTLVEQMVTFIVDAAKEMIRRM